MKIILASNSPRRKELLKAHNIEFDVIPSDISEVLNPNLSPVENVMELAKQKAEDVFNKTHKTAILAADTIVVYGNQILGKPVDEEDAFRMLRLLSGKTHQVITGVAFISTKGLETSYDVSNVTFKEISEEDILEYIKTKEPMDKAGSYAIQGIGSKFVESYDGEFDNIVGLPMKLVLEILKKAIES
jgi:septum formation protein